MEFGAYIDGSRVLILPADFAGQAKLRMPTGALAESLTSETPEPVGYWRDILARSVNLQVELEDLFAGQLEVLDQMSLADVEQLAGETLTNMRQLREALDHLGALGDLEQDWYDEFTERVAAGRQPLALAYGKLATAIYGTSYPLDPATREPVIAADIAAEVPVLESLATTEMFGGHELDGFALQSSFQGSALLAETCQQQVAEFGALVPMDLDEAPMNTTLMLVVDSLALTPVALAVCLAWNGIIEQTLQRAQQLVAWADTHNPSGR